MANCNDLFKKFYSEIDLTLSKKDQLRISKDAVRDIIKKYFKDILESPVPDFHLQGSFVIRTVVNPINGEYDIDDGIYLNNLPEEFEKWPTSEKVHNWILEAVKNQTNETNDKKNCVRVIYKNKYHIDLPIYGIYEEVTYLSTKNPNDKWIQSDPKSFSVWFHEQLNKQGTDNAEQLRRNIQYLKAWKDYKSIKFPSIAITILCCNYFNNIQERDDKSLIYTVNKIIEHLENLRIVKKPVYPFENVLAELNEGQINLIIRKLKELKADAEKAIQFLDTEKDKASHLWENHLGDRFPVVKPNSDESNSKLKENIIIPNMMPPRPWSSNEMV